MLPTTEILFSDSPNFTDVETTMSHLPTLEQTSKHIKFSPAVSGHLDKAAGQLTYHSTSTSVPDHLIYIRKRRKKYPKIKKNI